MRDYPINNFLGAFAYPHWALGNGIGTSSLGTEYLTSVFGIGGTGALVESGYGILLLEMGIPGLVAWLVWTVALVYAGWRCLRKLLGSPLFMIGFAILWFACQLLFVMTYTSGMQPYQNFIFNAYLWLLVGVLFRLPDLTARVANVTTTELRGAAA